MIITLVRRIFVFTSPSNRLFIVNIVDTHTFEYPDSTDNRSTEVEVRQRSTRYSSAWYAPTREDLEPEPNDLTHSVCELNSPAHPGE